MCPIVNPSFEGSAQAPDGTYRAEIKSVTQERSKAGNDYLKWIFAIVAPGESYNNRWVYFNTTWSGKGAEKFRELVRASVQPGYEKGPINTDDMIGKIVKITVFQEHGNAYEQVSSIGPDDEAFDSFDNFDSKDASL